jgi:hypothetical protein
MPLAFNIRVDADSHIDVAFSVFTQPLSWTDVSLNAFLKAASFLSSSALSNLSLKSDKHGHGLLSVSSFTKSDDEGTTRSDAGTDADAATTVTEGSYISPPSYYAASDSMATSDQTLSQMQTQIQSSTTGLGLVKASSTSLLSTWAATAPIASLESEADEDDFGAVEETVPVPQLKLNLPHKTAAKQSTVTTDAATSTSIPTVDKVSTIPTPSSESKATIEQSSSSHHVNVTVNLTSDGKSSSANDKDKNNAAAVVPHSSSSSSSKDKNKDDKYCSKKVRILGSYGLIVVVSATVGSLAAVAAIALFGPDYAKDQLRSTADHAMAWFNLYRAPVLDAYSQSRNWVSSAYGTVKETVKEARDPVKEWVKVTNELMLQLVSDSQVALVGWTKTVKEQTKLLLKESAEGGAGGTKCSGGMTGAASGAGSTGGIWANPASWAIWKAKDIASIPVPVKEITAVTDFSS